MYICIYKMQIYHVCLWNVLDSVCVSVCVRVCVCVTGLGQWANPLRHPSDPPCPPSCDGLSWMLMFCDGCGANKCFWHSTGSHYRSRPNGLASALMSRQVSQPQPLYQSHTLLMQGPTSTPLNQTQEKLTSAAVSFLKFYWIFFLWLKLWCYVDAWKVFLTQCHTKPFRFCIYRKWFRINYLMYVKWFYTVTKGIM